jgi:hypothetical protein
MTAEVGHLTLADVRREFQRFAEGKARGYGSVYREVAEWVLDSRELQALAAHARGRPVADLFLASVQYSVRRDRDALLLAMFDGRFAPEALDASVRDAFVSLCRRRVDEIGRTLRERRVQTNEPGRCAALLLGLAEAQRRVGGQPLHLIDLGCSAGLQLLFDHYDYHLVLSDGASVQLPAVHTHDAISPPVVRTRVHGGWRGRIPASVPQVTNRVGVDLRPLDLSEADDRLWVRSFVWPEERERAARMEGAVAVAARVCPRIITSDLIAALPRVLDEFAGAPVCVFHSHTRVQLSEADQQAMDQIVDTAVRAGRCVRLALEGHWGDLPAPSYESTLQSRAGLSLTTADEGRVLLAVAGSHGGWVEFL